MCWWRKNKKEPKKVEKTFNDMFFTHKAREKHAPKKVTEKLNPVTLSKLAHPARGSDDTK